MPPDAVRTSSDAILSANADDVAQARADGLSAAMIDRLTLDPDRLEGIARGIEAVAALRDPVGMVIDETLRPNGLKMTRVRVPLGVVGIIFESRPNVTADAGVLCLKSGNAAILRGGSDAMRTSRALHAAMVEGIVREGLPADAIQLVQTTDREAVGAMLAAHGLIDIIVPRGGKALVARVQADARVPVLAHLDGLCHTYVDALADPEKAVAITVNAKMRRTGICGATETVLIDRAYPHPGAIVGALIDAGCEVRGSAEVAALDPRVRPAAAADWDTEYLDSIVSATFVDGVAGAISHIAGAWLGPYRRDPDRGHHDRRTFPVRGRQRDRHVERFDAVRRRRRIRSGCRNRHRDRPPARARPRRARRLTTYKWQVRGTGQTRP